MRSTLEIITFIFMIFTAGCTDQVPVQVPVVQLYRMKGSTVHLSLEESSHNVKWRKGNELITRLENQQLHVKDDTKHGLDISGSLTIRNVTEKDSGIYQCQNGNWENLVIKYHLIVQEAVSAPVIVISPLQANSSADVCHVSVMCSANGDTATYDCDLQHCAPINLSLSTVNITVAAMDDGMMKCVASNHVSTKMTSSPMNITCSKKDAAEAHTPSYVVLALIMVLAFLTTLGLLGVCFLIKDYYTEKKQVESACPDTGVSTVYSVVQKRQTSSENHTATYPPLTVYDVPSKCVRTLQSTTVQMQKETQERPLEAETSTANPEVQEKSEDKQLTVYWTLGQKF